MENPVVLRVILDHPNEDIFRDLALSPASTLEDLHHQVVKAFGLHTGEMASFYRSNENWEQGDEVPLVGFEESAPAMADLSLAEVFPAAHHRLLYVYDFLQLWTFYVERVVLKTDVEPGELPRVLLAVGKTPEESPASLGGEGGEGGDFDEDDQDSFDQDDLEGFGEWGEEEF